MKIFESKKSEAITVILVTLIIIVVLGRLINAGSRECRSNSQCGSAQYCGSDFACHELPTIEKTIVKNNLMIPSIIIAIAVIIAAIILKSGRPPFRIRIEPKEKESNDTSAQKLKMP